MIQKNWPKKTLTRLIQAAQKPEVKKDIRFENW